MTAHSLWRRAGFSPFLELALLRLDVTQPLGRALHEVDTTLDLSSAESIDAAAFDDFWAMDQVGLEEALRSTKRSEILSVGDPMAGFAIIGYGTSAAYLQRLAVHPSEQGAGLGTSLILAAAARARRRGIRSMFLNTQIDNVQSLGLYDRLGFDRLEDGLFLLRTTT
ncbi:MAG: GNAT family N-acetyltransferase [Acidimicrobiia bacterium]|nr:GNAT family N-acetyltransferase [Acidimicrobiia bacterium]